MDAVNVMMPGAAVFVTGGFLAAYINPSGYRTINSFSGKICLRVIEICSIGDKFGGRKDKDLRKYGCFLNEI